MTYSPDQFSRLFSAAPRPNCAVLPGPPSWSRVMTCRDAVTVCNHAPPAAVSRQIRHEADCHWHWPPSLRDGSERRVLSGTDCVATRHGVWGFQNAPGPGRGGVWGGARQQARWSREALEVAAAVAVTTSAGGHQSSPPSELFGACTEPDQSVAGR